MLTIEPTAHAILKAIFVDAYPTRRLRMDTSKSHPKRSDSASRFRWPASPRQCKQRNEFCIAAPHLQCACWLVDFANKVYAISLFGMKPSIVADKRDRGMNISSDLSCVLCCMMWYPRDSAMDGSPSRVAWQALRSLCLDQAGLSQLLMRGREHVVQNKPVAAAAPTAASLHPCICIRRPALEWRWVNEQVVSNIHKNSRLLSNIKVRIFQPISFRGMSTPRFGIIARRMHCRPLFRRSVVETQRDRQDWGRYKGVVGHSRHDVGWDWCGISCILPCAKGLVWTNHALRTIWIVWLMYFEAPPTYYVESISLWMLFWI